ncbi:MAG: esterase/lipase family protein [Phycisphaerales bacterium]
MPSSTAAPARSKIHPIIIVPGITATGLTDWYPLAPRDIWSPARLAFADYEPVMLHPVAPARAADAPLAPRYEAVEPSLVRPSRPFGIVYDDLVAELRHDLSCDEVPLQPVYVFAYDWRQDNFVTIRRLADFIDEVIDRTRLMPHDPAFVIDQVCDDVDLIGHSMGGSIIAACLASGLVGFEDRCKVRRVVTLGAPFRGAPAAMTKLATGLGSLTGRSARQRERAAARVTPSVYQLLPTYPGGIVRPRRHVRSRASGSSLAGGADLGAGTPDASPGSADILGAADPEDVSLADVFAGQPSILESLAVFLRQHAPSVGSLDDPLRAARAAEAMLQDFIKSAQRFSRLVNTVHPGMLRRSSKLDASGPLDEVLDSSGDWLVIAGAAERTHIRCELLPGEDGRDEFDTAGGFSSDTWDPESWDTGDDTVPLRSAAAPWEDAWRDTIVLRRSDFETLGELGDRLLCSQLGLHAMLPRLDVAQRWIVNFLRPRWAAGLTSGYRQHGKVWARPSPSFWTAPEGQQARREIERAPSRRTQIVREALQRELSGKIPGIRLSPVGDA